MKIIDFGYIVYIYISEIFTNKNKIFINLD